MQIESEEYAAYVMPGKGGTHLFGLAFWRTVHDVPSPAERQGSHGGGPTQRMRRTRHVSHALEERRWGCRRSGPACDWG